MKVKFWGVRGSVPSPGPSTCRYGGNTSCIELTGQNGEFIVLDAGTGIRALGLHLLERDNFIPHIYLFISHTHWDHIQGFPFFAPCYLPEARISIRGPVHYMKTKDLKSIFDVQMQYDFFPISNQQLAADIDYAVLNETSIRVGSLEIMTLFSNHPIRSLMYRITEAGRSLVYTGDHEPYYNFLDEEGDNPGSDGEDDMLFGDMDRAVTGANDRFIDFTRGSDLLIADGQYTPEEYSKTKRGWGHSSWDVCLNWLKQSGTKKMVLTHHDPIRSDDALDIMLRDIHREGLRMGLDPQRIMLATEGMEMNV